MPGPCFDTPHIFPDDFLEAVINTWRKCGKVEQKSLAACGTGMEELVDTSYWLKMAQRAVLGYMADCRKGSTGIRSGDQFWRFQEASATTSSY